MKIKLLLTLLCVSFVGETIQAGRGGAFAGGLVTGAVVGSALASRPRSEVVYVERDDSGPSQAELDRAYDRGFRDARRGRGRRARYRSAELNDAYDQGYRDGRG